MRVARFDSGDATLGCQLVSVLARGGPASLLMADSGHASGRGCGKLLSSRRASRRVDAHGANLCTGVGRIGEPVSCGRRVPRQPLRLGPHSDDGARGTGRPARLRGGGSAALARSRAPSRVELCVLSQSSPPGSRDPRRVLGPHRAPRARSAPRGGKVIVGCGLWVVSECSLRARVCSPASLSCVPVSCACCLRAHVIFLHHARLARLRAGFALVRCAANTYAPTPSPARTTRPSLPPSLPVHYLELASVGTQLPSLARTNSPARSSAETAHLPRMTAAFGWVTMTVHRA